MIWYDSKHTPVKIQMRSKGTYVRCDSRPLHLVQNISHSCQVFDMCTIGVQLVTGPLRTRRQGVDKELRDTTGMDLEMQFTSNGVLPQLHEVYLVIGILFARHRVGHTTKE